MLANETPSTTTTISTTDINNNSTPQNSDTTKHSFNPFQVLYALDTEHKIRVDSAHMGNLSRYMRRSCQANCTLTHAFDTNGEVHLLVRARSDIAKGQELTLPFDFEREDVLPVLTKDMHGSCVCNCQRDKCPVREALLNCVTASENESVYVSSQKQQQNELKVETKVEVNNSQKEMVTTTAAATTALSTATNAELVKKKSPGVRRGEKKQQQSTLGHEESDELNKSLSREDRKLMSYVRVIERLERQGERKKELRQQKAEQKAAKAAAAAAAAKQQQSGEISVKVEHDKENNHKENGTKAASGKKNATSNDSKESASPIANQVDKEIESIIEGNPKGTKADTKVATPSLTQDATGEHNSSDKVKSPDFSFVNVSVRPRQTLNLLQRNLSSPTYCGSNLLPMDSMPSPLEATTPSTAPVMSSDITCFNQKKALFNPKKRWLKCSEEDSPPSATLPTQQTNSTPSTPFPVIVAAAVTASSSCDSIVSCPPKKRRHMFSDSDVPSHAMDDTSNESFLASASNNLSRSFTDSPNSQHLLNVNVSPTNSAGMPQTSNTTTPNSQTPPATSTNINSGVVSYTNFNHLTPSTPQLLTPTQQPQHSFPYPSALEQQQAFFDQQNLLLNQTLCYLHQQQQHINNEITSTQVADSLSASLSCVVTTNPLSAATTTALPLLGHFPALDSPTSQAGTPEQQHSPLSSQDAAKQKSSKKVSLSEYLQRKKKAKKVEPSERDRQITRENSADSFASSVAETSTMAVASVGTEVVETNSVNDASEEELSNKLPSFVVESSKDPSPVTFLDKESTVEVVESGKSKVNQLLTSLMAKNRQQKVANSAMTFDFASSPITGNKTGIDLFAKRSLFSNTKTTISPSNELTIKKEAGEVLEPLPTKVTEEPQANIDQEETQYVKAEDPSTKSRSSSSNSSHHRSRKSSASEPNSRSSSNSSCASSNVSMSLTEASSSVDSSRTSRSCSSKAAKQKAEHGVQSKSNMSSLERQREHRQELDRDRAVKDRELKREKRQARSSSGGSRNGGKQRRRRGSFDSKDRSGANISQVVGAKISSAAGASSRRAESEVTTRNAKQNMSSSSQSSIGSNQSGQEYTAGKYGPSEYGKHSSKTHSRHSSEFDRASEHRRKKLSHNSDDESSSMTKSRRCGHWEDMNDRRTSHHPSGSSRAPDYGRQFSSQFNGSSSSQRDQRQSSYRSSYNESAYSEFGARSRNRSKDRDGLSFSVNGPSMISQKFYHSKSSPYPARLTDDYNSYHHPPSHSSANSTRPYSSSSSKYYSSSDKSSVQRMSSASQSTNNKFDLRHQLNKTYYANQYEDRQRSGNTNEDAEDRSDGEDSRKFSRTSPVNGRGRSQQRSIHASSKSRID